MKKASLMLLLCLTCAIMSYGQDSNNELLKKLVEKQVLTQEEADELKTETTLPKEQKNSLAESTDKIRKAFNTPYMQFGGYGLFLYRYSDIDAVHHSAKPRVIFLSMRGEISKTLRYYLLAEFVKPMPFEFYGEWAPASEFNLKLGQMKTPLSLENQLSLTELETVANTRTVSYLIGMDDDVQRLQNGINNTGRDIGLMAHGKLLKQKDHSLIHYHVGVFQGTGINTSENNNTKDFATNWMLEPVKNFRIGGGIYLGKALYKPEEEGMEKRNYAYNRWIVSSDYKSDRFYARAEWIKGKDGNNYKNGIYGTALYYAIPKKLASVIKIDYFDKNTAKNQDVVDYTVGINYYFFPMCRLQLNYTYSDFSSNWGSRNSNVVLGQMQIVF